MLGTGWLIGINKEAEKIRRYLKVSEGRRDFSSRGKEMTTIIEL